MWPMTGGSRTPIGVCGLALIIGCWACGGGGDGDDCVADDANDAESSPVVLPDLEDRDPSPNPEIEGTLFDSSDTDWYRYTGTDLTWGIVDPELAFPGDQGLRVCSYFECFLGETQVSCPAGTVSDKSPSGRSGCCSAEGTGSFLVKSLSCPSADVDDDSMHVFIRIDGAGPSEPTACVPYTIRYHF
jgi:hypothetical protein